MGVPSDVPERRQVARAYRRPTGQTPSSFGGYSLPPDLADKAVRRIGFLGLVCALTAPAAYLTEYYFQPARVLLPGRVPLPLIAAVTLFVIGLAVFALAWSRTLAPALMIDLGLIFEVVGALAIALSEHAGPWPPDHPIRGISWICLWIAIFVVAVPGTYGKTVLAAFASACMAPVGFAIASLVNQNPLPTAEQLVILLAPNFLAAGWAIPVARYVHSLGAQVSKAREMGSYALTERIGRGGMGEVWRAQHRMLARPSAVKLIRPEVLGSDDPERASLMIHRFEREARATAVLHSPHTVSLYDFGVSDDGSFYYAMELLDGLDLESLVERFGPQPAARVIYWLRQACRALAEAHENGLVHRDIKPRNLFVCRLGMDYDFIKVLDFGLVKPYLPTEQTQTQLTAAGVTTGTPAYAAPELLTGKAAVDGRADLYSLGCVGYWLLTGRLVFEEDNAMAMALAHLQTPPPPPSKRTELKIPESLERVILGCLEKDAARRPQSARDLIRMLEACETGERWTQEEAERWWRTHAPSPNDATPLQVAAQAGTTTG